MFFYVRRLAVLEENNILKLYNEELKKLQPSVRKKFENQVDEIEMDIDTAYNYLVSTRKYNENSKKFRTKIEKKLTYEFKNKYIKNQSNYVKSRFTYEGTDKLTEEGKQALKRYIENKSGDIIPTEKKDILFTENQIKSGSYKKIVENRLKMGEDDYIDKRTEQYFENYRKALKNTKGEDAEEYIKLYDQLSTNEKISFMGTSHGMIKDLYPTSNSNIDNEIDLLDFYDDVKSINKKIKIPEIIAEYE